MFQFNPIKKWKFSGILLLFYFRVYTICIKNGDNELFSISIYEFTAIPRAFVAHTYAEIIPYRTLKNIFRFLNGVI